MSEAQLSLLGNEGGTPPSTAQNTDTDIVTQLVRDTHESQQLSWLELSGHLRPTDNGKPWTTKRLFTAVRSAVDAGPIQPHDPGFMSVLKYEGG
ncbi:hypothetical protein [Marinobacterium stanieri]|uniref:Uncharacterized protein n=1 Tax=Marinobacterium stanieri TaxID=49186 RepID=A0A1N6Q4S2_9GAMM|nr:hypothetical protein [Marinobacterium stanieri]SIQ11459.1 hypothetical protein SAMN05421647_102249 [Marinobacterium stanieri]